MIVGVILAPVGGKFASPPTGSARLSVKKLRISREKSNFQAILWAKSKSIFLHFGRFGAAFANSARGSHHRNELVKSHGTRKEK